MEKPIHVFVKAATTVHSIQQALNECWSLFPFLWQQKRSRILTVAGTTELTDQDFQKVVIGLAWDRKRERLPSTM